MPKSRRNQPRDNRTMRSRPMNRRLVLKLGGAALMMVGLAGYTAFSNVVEICEYTVPFQGLEEELRVLILTDAHLPSSYVSEESLKKVNHQFKPHLILILGDSVDQKGNETLLGYYRNLEASKGKFAILGNWEYWGNCDVESLKSHYASSGIKLLVNEVSSFSHSGSMVHLIGLDDFLGGQPNLELVREFNDGEPLIVMSHCPESFEYLPNFSLVALSGHTHGGQIAPLGLRLILPRGSGNYAQGWYEKGWRRLFVSRGIGNSVIPFRVGARPEISLLTFVPSKN